MTWLFTAQVAALALAIGVAGYFYARSLARAFDRRFGPPASAIPYRTGPRDGRSDETP